MERHEESEKNSRLKRGALWPSGFYVGLAAAATCIMVYLLIGRYGQADKDTEAESERLSRVVRTHDQRMRMALGEMTDSIVQGITADTLDAIENAVAKLRKKDDYSFYLFSHGELRYWHNAQLPTPNLTPGKIRTPIHTASNGCYYTCRRDTGDLTIMALLRVRCTFPYDNDYLTDSYHPSFGLPQAAGLTTCHTDSGVDVCGPDGAYLFSVTKVWERMAPLWLSALSVALLIVIFLALLWSVRCVVVEMSQRGRITVGLTVAFALILVVYGLMLALGTPTGLDNYSIFSVLVFSYDWWVPTLWNLMLLAVCTLHWGYLFFRIVDSEVGKSDFITDGRTACNWPLWAWLVAHILVALLAFVAVNGFIELIVRHSQGLAFYAGEVDMSAEAVTKVIIIGTAFMAFTLIEERVAVAFAVGTDWRTGACYLAAASGIAALVGNFAYDAHGAIIGLGFAILGVVFYLMKKSSPESMRFSHFVWIVMLTSGCTLVRTTQLNESKEQACRQLMASNLASQMMREDDPIAEQLLPQIHNALVNDSTLRALMSAHTLSHDQIYTYVRNRFFNGYFSRYDMQVIPCRGTGSTIQMTNNGDIADCVAYFGQLVDAHGRRLPKAPHFYCLDDGDGRPCYIGHLIYDKEAPRPTDSPNRLYIQIILKTKSQAVGYPELLTNKRDHLGENMMKGYSYAKYVGKQLAFHYGTFDYPITVRLSADHRPIMPSDKTYSHQMVTPSAGQTIIISYPRLSIQNILTCFSYMFLILLVVSTLVIVAASGSRRTFIGRMSISERIHAGLVFFITAFFAVICVVSGYQAVGQYEEDSKRHLSAAMSAYSISLGDELYDYAPQELRPSAATASEVDYILQRVSNSTGVDAHLYDSHGQLLGTSRRELFLSGIAAPLMNSEALDILRQGEMSEAFVAEHIGSMVHYASYSPLHNNAGELLGYVGVPFFNDVKAMRAQVISSIVPISSSLMFIIILSIVASYIIARGITRPLVELRDVIKRVDLNSDDAKLNYPYDDEVGQVVTAYNRMTDKLSDQAEKLAATERESTWREMARQIAHEIKNPLTPMKLSVQYLLKVWDTRRENFEPMLRKTSQTLIEQMDQLASVASQFSGIAKMKQAEPVRMDLAAKISATATLFSRTDEAEITYNGAQEGIFVKADPDLLTSVFNNLIKNAQQSASDGRRVNITVALTANGDTATVTVADDGDGIRPEVRDKIFRPNFTTKSTGMGLGLAITKTIVDNTGGTITFETAEGRGTTFRVEIPQCQ